MGRRAAGPPAGGIVIVRHGATEWSESGRHTGSTDLPLTAKGRHQATQLAGALDPGDFDLVLCSPLRRARETCELTGFGDRMEIEEDLREWDYGDYEGLTSDQIRRQRPDWSLWRDGCPGGESPEDVSARVDRVLERVLGSERSSDPDRGEPGVAGGARATAIFAHGHILRSLSARWIEMEVSAGARLALRPAGIGALGHERDTRVIAGWNVSEVG